MLDNCGPLLKAENIFSSTTLFGSKGMKYSKNRVKSKARTTAEQRNKKHEAKVGFHVGITLPGDGDLYILYAATGVCFLSCCGMVASAAQLPSSRSPHKQLVARRKSWVQNSLSEHLGKQSKSYCILKRL